MKKTILLCGMLVLATACAHHPGLPPVIVTGNGTETCAKGECPHHPINPRP